MLLALTRIGASLKLFNSKGSSKALPQLLRAHLPQTRYATSQPKANDLQGSSRFAPTRPFYGHLAVRPLSTTTMFKQAVQNHHAVTPISPPNPAFKQQSLGSTFSRTGPQRPATRPLAQGTKPNGVGMQRTPGQGTHGVKRTSSGLAKSLSSQEDIFNYPTLEIAGMEKENGLPITFHTSSRSNPASLASALFDENDFDSDVDLDVEDPATKGTVAYPKLPTITPTGSRDFEYQSWTPPANSKALELDSSQPIPWSSSPIEHFKTPQKPALPKAKRAFLPWSQNQKMQPTEEQEDQIESEEETLPPKKRKSGDVAQAVSTPAPKAQLSQYMWNTTASALKKQQKSFREQTKAQSQAAKGVEEDVKEAIRKKKKNTVHRIFLSEEQQNVLNLVTEYKKSVFFTGSAGTITFCFVPGVG
ncbi:hypothetical protein BKA66DRAFT_63042 [Pyrenochaeta sp. MPI-SDFR-AT-0127]|nr:hypothetical protein BKA66DRAFT_63042 [Pyrenochaeta sp. MPI-SDFR-AT-0127]